MLTALCTALPARLGLVDDRQRGRAAARRLGGGRRRRWRCRTALAAVLALTAMLLCAAACVGGAVDRARRRAAPAPRRQRDHQQPAAVLHRARALPPPGRRTAARSGELEQAVHLSDRRTANMLGTIAGHGRALRPACSASCACVVAYVLMEHTTFGFAARVVGGNVRAARLTGLPVTQLDAGHVPAGRRRGRPRRHDRGHGGPRHGQRLARTRGSDSRGFWWRSWRASIRSAIIPVAHPARRHSGQRRPAAAPARPAGRRGGRVQGHLVRGDPGQRDLRRAQAPGCDRTLVDKPAAAEASAPHSAPRAAARGGVDDGEGIGLWGVPLAMLGGAIRVSTPYLFVSLGEMPDREERAHEPRASKARC